MLFSYQSTEEIYTLKGWCSPNEGYRSDPKRP